MQHTCVQLMASSQELLDQKLESRLQCFKFAEDTVMTKLSECQQSPQILQSRHS
jgi:hypothetical protein